MNDDYRYKMIDSITEGILRALGIDRLRMNQSLYKAIRSSIEECLIDYTILDSEDVMDALTVTQCKTPVIKDKLPGFKYRAYRTGLLMEDVICFDNDVPEEKMLDIAEKRIKHDFVWRLKMLEIVKPRGWSDEEEN